MKERINLIAAEIEPQLIEIRRCLHKYPEVSMEEYKTSQIIATELDKIEGIKVIRNIVDGTGVIGILEGAKPGKCIMLRADIDALPVKEENNLEFKSQNEGYMHACGHDAHITWVLGAAMILSKMRDELAGTVKFIFQPGEELGLGAKEMIEKGRVLENPKVDFAFAAHAWPSIESGKIGIAEKYAFGCPGSFSIVIKGKGGHGSWPHLAVNPIMVASQICLMFGQIISLRVDEVEPRAISVGAIQAGTPGVGNIIPEICNMNGTIRATNMRIMEQLIDEIENVVKYCCEMNGAEYEINTHIGGQSVENNKKLVILCKECADDILGFGNGFIIEKPNLGGENFAEYSKRVPSAYMYVGIKNEELAKPFSLHSPQFMLDEMILSKAAAVFTQIVFKVNET